MSKKKKSRKQEPTNLEKVILATATLELIKAVIDLITELIEK